ncbi:MAG: phosphoribosylamine--glycine ligase [Gemmatimonadaceae bacterium]
MKVLIVGGGGREHALAWAVSRDAPSATLLAAPGNPGIARHARCRPVRADDVPALLALAEAERVDLTIVGPEAPLALGLVDRFRERGLAAFGPTQAAARIETSKAFAKELLHEAGIPTARAERHTDAAAARRAARELALGGRVVVKASGLAAGKGVVVASSLAEADEAIDAMLTRGAFGDAGAEILVEEFMEGEELSVFGITDGKRVLSLAPAQDHKRLLEGDRGPNTGGMGAYAPVSLAYHAADDRGPALRGAGIAVPALMDLIDSEIMLPTLEVMAERGSRFTGLLYAGLMLTSEGPKVVEFNCRFGDPETQAVLPVTDFGGQLLGVLHAVASGGSLSSRLRYDVRGCAVATVLAASGYPEKVRTGDEIALPPEEPGVHVFHAGTARDAAGTLRTAGGRVLAVTGVADDFEEARRLSRTHAERVQFAGRQFRGDIGWREIARSGAGAS